MTTEDQIRARRAQAAAEEHDEQLQSLLHQTYRQLEHAYHCSPEYGRMVERYPVLARAIARCRQPDLVGDPTALPSAPSAAPSAGPSATAAAGSGLRRRCRPVSQLHWQRSHGEL